jgi:ribosomal protein S18 acetylase RimI-like enzyme
VTEADAIEIRPLRPEDVREVVELHDRTFPRKLSPRADAQFVRGLVARSRRRAARSAPPWTLVAADGERVAGFVTFHPLGGEATSIHGVGDLLALAQQSVRLGTSGPRDLAVEAVDRIWETFDNTITRGDFVALAGDRYVSMLAVTSQARGRGIGQRLLDHVVAHVLETRATGVWLHCWEAKAARGFYEHLGFVPIVRFGPHYADGSPATLMVLPLAR